VLRAMLGLELSMAEVHEQTWDVLEQVLTRIRYTRDQPPDGRFQLVRDDVSNYAVLYIFTYNPNTYRPDEMRYTRHEFVVPVATYHHAAWRRWLFDRILSIENHETSECFQELDPDACIHCGSHDEPNDDHTCTCSARDGECEHVGPWRTRPYAPHHGKGWDPYTMWYDGHPDEQAKAPDED
jgi:hypothetical protein